MKVIDVEGLPEPVAQALETVVQTLRRELHEQVERRPQIELPVWPGTVHGRLTREEIYEDVG